MTLAFGAILLAVVGVNSCSAGLARARVASKTPAPEAALALPKVSYDVPTALARLKDADSSVYNALADRDNPQLSERGGYATYTWEYARKVSKNKVQTGRMSISLDGQGNIVGVDSR